VTSTKFTTAPWRDGKQVIRQGPVVVGLLWSNPDDLTFTLRYRTREGNRHRFVQSLETVKTGVETLVFEALSWKEAKRVAFTLLRLEQS
jgi:hypothetical protein